MKTLFTFIALCLIGCSAAPETEQTSLNAEETPALGYGSTNESNTGSGACDQVYYKKITVDGQEVWQPLPTICNTGFNINKGDPSPDKGRPPESDLKNINDIKILEQH